jgi:dolichyl-phosphate-mannose--protein O-mannosyl transferase
MKATLARNWWVTSALAFLAGILRLHNLGTPHALVFDETYYAKDAWSLLKYGYEVDTVKDANEKILAGMTDVFTGNPSYVVHPPFGKWVIAAGEQMFGWNPYGWRFMMAVLGVGAVILVHRVALRLFNHNLTAFLAGLFMAIDGMAIVHSRTALLDQTLMFLTLAAFVAIVMDRDFVKQRLEQNRFNSFYRPWIYLAAILLALACATKWSGVWFVIGIGLLVIFFEVRTRIGLGKTFPVKTSLASALKLLPIVVVLLITVYTATWYGWIISDVAYNRNWAAANPKEGLQFLPEVLRSLIHYHQTAFAFHTNLTTSHSYQSNPWSWPLNLRPTSFYYEEFAQGVRGCGSDKCAEEVVALGNPLIWWAATLAILQQIWLWFTKRDGRALAIVVMFLSAWAPWLLFQQRTVFSFYAIVMLPYMVLALASVCGQILGPVVNTGKTRAKRALLVGTYVTSTVLLSAFFYPIWTGELIPKWYWQIHMWFGSWI